MEGGDVHMWCVITKKTAPPHRTGHAIQQTTLLSQTFKRLFVRWLPTTRDPILESNRHRHYTSNPNSNQLADVLALWTSVTDIEQSPSVWTLPKSGSSTFQMVRVLLATNQHQRHNKVSVTIVINYLRRLVERELTICLKLHFFSNVSHIYNFTHQSYLGE